LAQLAAVPDLAVLDLATFRLRPWRRGLAEAFERFSWSRAGPTQARISHTQSCGAVASSRALGRWLEQRLGASVAYQTVGGASGGASAAAEHEPRALELTWGRVHVAVRRRAQPPALRIEVTLDQVCLLPWELPASRGEPGDLLAAAFDLL
jgi:hypothetical protein